MSCPSTGLYEFGPFQVDLRQRVFMRDGQVLPLAPKTFDLLLVLVQSPARAFSKQELMNALWPDTFVEEANLSFQVSVLRKNLGEEGARWIETVPKYGYRFTANVRPTGGAGSLPAEPLSARDEPVSVEFGDFLWIAESASCGAATVHRCRWPRRRLTRCRTWSSTPEPCSARTN